MLPRILPSLVLSGACCLLLPLMASAQDMGSVSNWLAPSPPPAGTNTATYPEPQNSWMSHFARNVERVKGKDVELAFDGDSITDGWQGNGRAVWAKYYEGRKATDFGISGDRTENVLWRLDHGQMKGLHPKLVALMIGTNNLAANPEAQITEGITEIIKKYQTLCPDAVILLQAIFPRGEKADNPLRQKIKNINAALAKLGDGQKVIYVDFGDKFLEPDGTLTKDIMPDFLHPNARGYEIWAEAIQPEVDKVLGPLPAAQ